MIALLQSKAEKSGVEIISFELSDLSYAPEIAQSMLVRQQAQALVDARRIIVDGAVGIASDTLQNLENDGITFSDMLAALHKLNESIIDLPAKIKAH